MKMVSLTQGQFAIVDDEMYEIVNKHKWHAFKGKTNKTFYARTNIEVSGKKTNLLLHRLIMGVNDPNIKVDHRDMDGLNNGKANLRVCSHQKNCFNKSSAETSTSKYLGVYLKVDRKPKKIYTSWAATIKKDGVNFPLGTFKDEESAAHAYDEKAKELFGEFANLNFKSSLRAEL